MNGYLCICRKCGNERYSKPNPLRDGWPVCCEGMVLVDTDSFARDVDRLVGECFAPVTSIRAMIDGE